MRSLRFLLFVTISQLLQLCHAQQSQILLPKPNGTYIVGLTITELIDSAHLQPFAPGPEPRPIGISVFYPTSSTSTTPIPYFPPETARVEDIEQRSPLYDLVTPNGTFESLALQLAPTGSPIAPAPNNTTWPVLLFSPAQGTSRHFYNDLASQISSAGYVVISFETPYDTDVFQFLNGTILLANSTISPDEANAIIAVNVRTSDASFILDKFSTASYTSSLIPGCSSCLNTTHVGMYGHSVGGATGASLMLTEPRLAGALNYDGALFGDVIEKGFDKPFMLMTFANQTRAATNLPNDPDSSWFAVWPKLTGPKFDFVFADSLHYTYSDFPIVLDTLGLHPNASAMKLVQITTLDGARALHIVTSYTLAFFDFVLHGKTSPLLEGPSGLFPEISIDDTKQASSTTSATGSSASATSSGKASSGAGRVARDMGALVLGVGVAVMLST